VVGLSSWGHDALSQAEVPGGRRGQRLNR
jgi:hypothetical protein